MHLLLLTEIGRIIGEAETLQEVLDGVVHLVADRVRTDVCSIWLLNAPRTRLTLAATHGLAEQAVGEAYLNEGKGLTWRVLEEMEPVVVEDVSADDRFFYLKNIEEEPFHSYLGLPLQVRGLGIGVLYVQTREPRTYTEDEVYALSAIASQIAPVVDNARLLSLMDAEEKPAARPATPRGPRHYFGTPCSSGIVSGPLLRLNTRPPPETGPKGTRKEELERLHQAFREARRELLEMQEWLRQRNAEEAALVFSVQLMMLDDPAFEGRMREQVQNGDSAHRAVRTVTANVLKRFARLKDMFFRERSADVQDLSGRLLRHVRAQAKGRGESLRGKIAVLPVLAPSRMVSLCAEGVAGVLTGGGGATSHAALLARSLDLPLIVGLGDFVLDIRDGQRVLADAASGEVVLEPPDDMVAEATRAATAGVEALREFRTEVEGESRIRYEANVSLWGDAVRAREENADGIGLYRTEFAFLMRPDLPSEEEQYVLYRRVVEAVAPKPVTFRLLDAGGDKLVPALGPATEPNPFLGYRSLRLLLDHPDLLTAQSRAILHALEGTEGRLLVPMVSAPIEVRAIRRILGHLDLPMPQVGAMVEVPSALMALDELAEQSDFLSIGTNDLTQHLLAVDRTNARVTRFFDPCHPAIIRAVVSVAEAAQRAGKPLCVCGEAASNPLLLPLWLGLGVERLCVHVKRIRILRHLESRLDLDAARALARDVSKLTSADRIRDRLAELATPEVREYVEARGGV